MLQYFVLLIAHSAVFVTSDLLGPKYPPTNGEIWPKPLRQISENIYFTLNSQHFNFTVQGATCTILDNAIQRYSFMARDMRRIAKRYSKKRGPDQRPPREQSDNYNGNHYELRIHLTSPCEDYPYFGMVESYNLTVRQIAQLTSSSIWGILRGMESWSQLLYISTDEEEIRINKTYIVDAPSYIHRGLLIDTSRHYLSLSKIIKTVDAMAMNKMNVLHWHIVDDPSFPYQSKKFPNLSLRGAYHSSMIYKKNDIKMIINYARDRGIRVLPEFDVPGHTRSWGEAYPDLLTTCYQGDAPTHLGPMNPINDYTYKFLQELIVEIQDLFPDKYFHIGGDEVDLACWYSNPVVVAYMLANNISSPEKLHAMFMQRVVPLLGQKSKPIVWQEVYDEGVSLPDDTLIQVWKWNYVDEMLSILRSGYKLIFSAAWYLDNLKSTWQNYYDADPRKMLTQWNRESTYNLDNIVGGEACMWGEMVNDINVMSRVWPRASAVAEVLWSGANEVSHDVNHYVNRRLEEHVCRMNRRGIGAEPPSGPGFCLGASRVI